MTILVAIPFGSILAPLAIGVIIVVVGLRRMGPDLVADESALGV